MPAREVIDVRPPVERAFLVGAPRKELGRRMVELGVTLAIFDEELSPTQGKHLEDALERRVMDRTD